MEKICELKGVPIYGTLESELDIKPSNIKLRSNISKRKLEKKVNKLYYKGGISINAYYELIKVCE